ncbi:MAG: YbgC/FadM family acyl-CoA thioesterase [Pseudomonadota bacterium]
MKQDFRFIHRLRVRWAEVDMQKIVFNAHYLMYLDTAVSDYWRAMALPYEATLAQLGGDLFVKKASLEYHASARYDDALAIRMRCARIGTSSLVFDAEILRGEQLLVGGELLYVYADPATQKSQSVPDALRAALNGFEAREPMLTLHTGSWDDLQADAAPLRSKVFVHEQGVPEAMEWDADDALSQHVVARNRMGVAVGTGRLLPAVDGVSRLGRMAVLREVRGAGVGHQVLLALRSLACARGDRQIVIHAQRSAERFYRQAGFVAQGEGFLEAGIDHVEMRLDLPA